MRARKCTTEGPEDGQVPPPKGFAKQDEENTPELTKRKTKVQREDGRTGKPRRKTPDLTKKDLLHLLGVMEGEVQAREDIIGLLRTDRTGPEVLEAHYGSSAPARPLQALQRDAVLGPAPHKTDQVYEKPMAQLQRVEEQQKETYRRMLEQLLMAEKLHRRTVTDLNAEKLKHVDFMNKSDDFTELLEHERERLKRLLEQEKEYQARKEQEHGRRLEKVRAELLKLKSFALMLVDERQLHLEQMDAQSQKNQELTLTLQDTQRRLEAAADVAKDDGQKLLALEAELEHRAARFARESEEMRGKLEEEESQSRQLRLKVAGLERRMEELEENNKELQELREKTGGAELENLRRRVMEMEDKDEEISKTESQCRELRTRLQEEENHGKELRMEVEKLQRRRVELEKLEGAFSRRETERSQLRANLERERGAIKDLSAELVTVKSRLKDLETSEETFKKTEMILREDLVKLKSFTLILVEERRNMAERFRQEEKKSQELSQMLKAEQGKVTEVTERLIDESKKLLRFKSEMETLVREQEELRSKLRREEEKLSEVKIRMDQREREWAIEDGNRKPDQDSRVKDLTLEMERLRSRLKHLEGEEGDLRRSELEQKLHTERDLAALLQETRGHVDRKKAAEAPGPEAQLRLRCEEEEQRSRQLRLDVQALKEKIHQLMNKEDQLSQLRADYALLQRRLLEEEEKKRSVGREVEELTRELEATRCYSRTPRPSLDGRRMVDVQVTSTGAQTEVGGASEEETTAGFIRKSVLEENHLMSNLRQRDVKKPAVLERYPPASMDVGASTSWTSWMMRKKEGGATSQRAGQPLHIRVTPDHRNSTATLEITSPRAEDFFSSATVIPTLGLQTPRITIKPSAAGSKTGRPDGVRSPVTITTVSRARSPAEGGGGLRSPVSIITVSTTPVPDASPEPHDTCRGRTLIKVGPQKEAEPPHALKYNSNIVTTEDNKIHIRLKRSSEGGGGLRALSAESTGTVLRSPRRALATPSKMTSSITITPVTTATNRTTQPVPGADLHSAGGGATRIPVSRGLKPSGRAVLGVSAVARAGGHAMKIELMKSTLCGVAAATGGKS